MIKQKNDVNWDKMNECAGGDLFIANTDDVEIKKMKGTYNLLELLLMYAQHLLSFQPYKRKYLDPLGLHV